VLATDDIEEILGLGADCVLYMPRALDVDEVCRLLESGSNIVTTRGEFHHPGSMDTGMRERVEAACRAGGTSIHSTGSSPGFISEAVPLVLTSIQRELESLVIEEFADLSMRDSPELLFDLMGFGTDPSTFDPGRWSHGEASFGPSLRLMAESVGLPLDAVEATGEVAVARRTTEIVAGRLEAGTVAAQRMRVDGLRGGRRLLSFMANWYCTDDLEPAWDLGPTGWRLTVAGDAPLSIDMRFDFPLEEMGAYTPGYTANRAQRGRRGVPLGPGHPHDGGAAPGGRHPPGPRALRPLPELTPAVFPPVSCCSNATGPEPAVALGPGPVAALLVKAPLFL
jgi:hypothetical protein